MIPGLTDLDIYRLMKGKVSIVFYHQISYYRTIEELLGRYKQVIILYEKTQNIGHWCTIFLTNRGVEFFDPIGEYIDDQLYYANFNKTARYISKLLIEYGDRNVGKSIEYNATQFQRMAQGIDSCGYHCIVRLWNKEMTLETYTDKFTQLAKDGIDLDNFVYLFVKDKDAQVKS